MVLQKQLHFGYQQLPSLQTRRPLRRRLLLKQFSLILTLSLVGGPQHHPRRQRARQLGDRLRLQKLFLQQELFPSVLMLHGGMSRLPDNDAAQTLDV